VGVFTAEQPVDYHGPDQQPVDVFFVTLCPPSERQTHLMLLSGIARLTLETPLLQQLRQAPTDEAILAAVRDCSSTLSR
jgi:mannitol/fructose-specific phosphotransferase system IIA component (Ntr-type)